MRRVETFLREMQVKPILVKDWESAKTTKSSKQRFSFYQGQQKEQSTFVEASNLRER